MFEDLLRRLHLDVTGLADVLSRLLSSPIVRGKLVSVTLPSGTMSLTIKHGLGRAAKGAIIVTCVDPSNIYAVQPATNSTDITLLAGLSPGSDVAITLWVF